MTSPILVADDDAAIVDVVTIILEGEGRSVLIATNEKEVFALLKKHTPQFVLLDISLGGSDGRVIAKKLKQSKETQNLPVIISSAHANIEDVANEVGADGFLAKPFEIDQLVSIVNQYAEQ